MFLVGGAGLKPSSTLFPLYPRPLAQAQVSHGGKLAVPPCLWSKHPQEAI